MTTAVVLAAAVLLALLLLPPTWLTGLLGVIFLGLGGWEGKRLAGLESTVAGVFWLLGLAAAGVALVWASHDPRMIGMLFVLGLVFWLLLSLWLKFPLAGRPAAGEFQAWKLPLIAAVLLFAFISIAWLHFHQPWLVIYLLLIVAAADIGAFFTGRHFGGARLAPRISPGKTWSGVFGGLVLAMLTAAVAARWIDAVPLSAGLAVIAAVPLVALSIWGDLMISLLKRHRGLKDTSALLPGHGGLLDRIDSIAAAAPAWALLVWWQIG
ncbi:MAG: phosphatidate cytidylyltransferase [Wenzhouxiangellaceae bacterium]